MTEKLKKNTIEYVSKVEGKINYDVNNPIKKDNDLDAQLIYVLGNPQSLRLDGKKVQFKEGETFELPIFYYDLQKQNKNNVDFVQFKIVKIHRNASIGFTGAILKVLTGERAGETILWADGSKGFANIFKNINVIGTGYELVVDWLINNIFQIGHGEIFDQLRELKKFAEDYGIDKINTGIGQSMMGIGVSALAVTKGYENINFRAYSGTLREDLYKAIAKEWGLNAANGSNLESYITPQEPLTRLYKPIQLPNMRTFMMEKSSQEGIKSHSGIAYFSPDGKTIIFYEITYNEDKYDSWGANPRLEYEKSPTGNGNMVVIKWDIETDKKQKNSTENPPHIIKYINSENSKSKVKYDSEIINENPATTDNDLFSNIQNKQEDSSTNTENLSGMRSLDDYDKFIRTLKSDNESIKDALLRGENVSYDVEKMYAENLSEKDKKIYELENSIEKINKQIEEIHKVLKSYEKVMMIYNNPVLAEFYLDEPVRNIMASVFQDYCIMEGIDYEEEC